MLRFPASSVRNVGLEGEGQQGESGTSTLSSQLTMLEEEGMGDGENGHESMEQFGASSAESIVEVEDAEVGDGEMPCNPLLLQVATDLKANESVLARQLLMRLLAVSKRILFHYVLHFPFSLEPKLSLSWMAAMALAASLVRRLPLSGLYPPPPWQPYYSIGILPFSHPHSLFPDLSLEEAVRLSCPRGLTKKSLSLGLQSTQQPLVQYQTLQLMLAILRNVHENLVQRHHFAPLAPPPPAAAAAAGVSVWLSAPQGVEMLDPLLSEDHQAVIHHARRSILADLLQLLPDVQVLLGVKGSVFSGNREGCEEGVASSDNTLSASLWLSVMHLYLACMPEVCDDDYCQFVRVGGVIPRVLLWVRNAYSTTLGLSRRCSLQNSSRGGDGTAGSLSSAPQNPAVFGGNAVPV